MMGASWQGGSPRGGARWSCEQAHKKGVHGQGASRGRREGQGKARGIGREDSEAQRRACPHKEHKGLRKPKAEPGLVSYAELLVRAALAEDIGSGDIKTNAIVRKKETGDAGLMAKADLIVA